MAENKLKVFRNKLLRIDEKLIELLDERAGISEEIGRLKFSEKIKIEQNEFWEQSTLIRQKIINRTHLDMNLSNRIFQLIQKQSVRIQKETAKKMQHEQ